MAEAAPALMGAWTTFYVTIATSAATLVGLLFVMISFVNMLPVNPDGRQAGFGAYSTPLLVHFAVALLVSLVALAPWRSLIPIAAIDGIAGAGGLAYMIVVVLRTRRLETYEADLEDAMWYLALPFIAYAAIFASAIALARSAEFVLFVLAGGVALLVFVGIRNAWDIVTYIAVQVRDDDPPRTSR